MRIPACFYLISERETACSLPCQSQLLPVDTSRIKPNAKNGKSGLDFRQMVCYNMRKRRTNVLKVKNKKLHQITTAIVN